MCVLTYFPLENGFILTSNRDEATARELAIPPKKYKVFNEQVFFPKDPRGGGTWIATHVRFTLCLLNGAEQKHEPTPPYRQSRGLVIPEFFEFDSVQNFLKNYQFEGLEPFTLVVIDNENRQSISQIRWNGVEMKHTEFDRNEARIWSSSTLYSDDVVAFREICFSNLIETKEVNNEMLLDFHENGGGDDVRNRLLMNRDNVLKTLSLTQIIQSEENYTIQYQDLISDKNYQFRIFREESSVFN